MWELARAKKVSLLTSRRCYLEAEVNLERKYPEKLADLNGLMSDVAETPDGHEHLVLASELIPGEDAHVLAAALGADAGWLITGDVTHFGHLMTAKHAPIKVRRLRDFLTEAPEV